MLDALPRALVFMTGRNCQRYVTAALESLAWQTHRAMHVLFVDDASEDDTLAIAKRLLAKHFPGRHTLVCNAQPWGKARSACVHLRGALGQGDFVAVVDADDQLILSTILADLAREYAVGFDVVWTNYETDDGGVGRNGPLDPLRSPRGQGWRSSHLFSFRSELLAEVPQDRFEDERGQWLRAACDFAIAYPVLDQTRRYRFLPVQAYRYTASNPNSHHNQDPQAAGFSSRLQMACADQVLRKPALPCRRWVLGHDGVPDAVLHDTRKLLLEQLSSAVVQMGQLIRQVPQAQATPQISPAAASGQVSDAAWCNAAAQALAQRSPALLDLMLDSPTSAMDLRTAWHWWSYLQAGGRAARVLSIGSGPLSAPLHAMIHALGGQMLTVVSDRDQALALYARLHAAGLDAQVMQAPIAEVSLDGHQAFLPDLSTLPDTATGFDLFLVDADTLGRAPAHALMALPLATPRLSGEGFRVCLWAPDQASLRAQVRAFWQQLLPELDFSDHAFHGRALCVHAICPTDRERP